MADMMTGGCACGRIRYEANVETDEAYLCHCRMCQRATGGVSIAFKNLKKADVHWEEAPDYYASSPIARRPFCRECGTPLGFEYPDSENLDLTVGSFDDPSRFRPAHHFGAESMHRAWIDTKGLREYRTEDYKPLVDRWVNAVGKLPD
ncbi:GFA family protein [Sphingosinicella rhizophila]|uniref:GFA family protein n=1 Tax=Sphingosinicella rhizophila TaxID=3050082 RepID=A0ABU3Q3Q3_9SPHN|nr:GFA family protein [Sphingosinicella sp. GR2756]MDT9597580.1 GFA family protein [Sphingosinicella sp. GR2756]